MLSLQTIVYSDQEAIGPRESLSPSPQHLPSCKRKKGGYNNANAQVKEEPDHTRSLHSLWTSKEVSFAFWCSLGETLNWNFLVRFNCLTWLASDAGFSMLSLVLAWVAGLSASLGVAVSVAGCCSRVCTCGWEGVLFSSVWEAMGQFLLGGYDSRLDSRVLSSVGRLGCGTAGLMWTQFL